MSLAKSNLPVVGSVQLPGTPATETRKCFKLEKRWGHRDADFDQWLPEIQRQTDPCNVMVIAPSSEMTAGQWAIATLGVPVSTPEQVLTELLKECGHTMTLPQVEKMV